MQGRAGQGRLSMFTKKTKNPLKEPYSLAWHRVAVNGWPIERLIKASVDATEQFVTLYKTASGEWTEDKAKALWYPWNYRDGNLCADVRYSKRWIIDGVVFTEYEKAFDYLEARILGKAIIAISETLI